MKRQSRGLRLKSVWRFDGTSNGATATLEVAGVTAGGELHVVKLSLDEIDVRRLFREATTLLKGQRDAYARQWNAAGELLKGAAS